MFGVRFSSFRRPPVSSDCGAGVIVENQTMLGRCAQMLDRLGMTQRAETRLNLSTDHEISSWVQGDLRVEPKYCPQRVARLSHYTASIVLFIRRNHHSYKINKCDMKSLSRWRGRVLQPTVALQHKAQPSHSPSKRNRQISGLLKWRTPVLRPSPNIKTRRKLSAV